MFEKSRFSVKIWISSKNLNFSKNLNKVISEEYNRILSNWPEKLPSGIIHADLFPDNVLFNDNKIGTLFYPVEKPIGNKKSWLSHAIQTVGKITLDDGASFAIKKKGASLLAVGIKNVEGNFTVNQAVKIVNTNDKEVAKGLVSMGSDKLRSILNNKENNIKNEKE